MSEQTTISKQRERQGVVVSDKMDKTIVVEVSAVHPMPSTRRSSAAPAG